MILYNFAKFKGYDLSKTDNLKAFADGDKISPYALPAMKWAVKVGIINGIGDELISPKSSATRAQKAVVVTPPPVKSMVYLYNMMHYVGKSILLVTICLILVNFKIYSLI